MLRLLNHWFHKMIIKLVKAALFRAACASIRHHALCNVRLKTACSNLTIFAFLGNLLIELLELMPLQGSLVKGSTVKGDNRVELVVRTVVTGVVAEVVVGLLGLDYRIWLKARLVTAVKQRAEIDFSVGLDLGLDETWIHTRTFLALTVVLRLVIEA